MAVTYAWRLDANKYAYLIDPTHTGNTIEYGYASNAPLNGTQLATVAETCNNLFGDTEGTLGFSGYTTAFNAMITKINEKWQTSGAEFYDLLSADVYYNVDASQCADLKGVGIRGIHYLGASTAYDPRNPSWDPSIIQTNTTALAGKFSIYGIYMDDQEGDETTNLSPERIFAVYNGSNGRDMNGNFGTDVLQDMIEAEQARSTAVDTQHEKLITDLRRDVNLLSRLNGGDLSELMTRINSLTARVVALENAKTNLEEQIKELSDKLEAIKDPSSGSGGVDNPSSGANITIENYNNGAVSLVGIGDDDTLYRIQRAVYNNDNVNVVGKVTASSFYQNE
jgi:polyhydroxyalkanoate synthesis regulator phasin